MSQNAPSLENTLRISVDKLYVGGEGLLSEIEAGLNNKRIENPRVGFQGTEGSFGEQAAREYFNDSFLELKKYHGFDDLLEAVANSEVDYGVLPIENSTAGDVLEVSDLIVRYNLYIVGEHTIRIRHNLLCLPEAELSDITEVYSHPQALNQCREFLKAHSNITACPYANTALAGEYVSQKGDIHSASIGSLRCAELYGLKVLAEGIQTMQNNFTRFIVISKHMELNDSCGKISIVFSAAHSSGSLHSALSHFAYNGLNLVKIQSRPKLDEPWEYLFFLDIEGNLSDANVLIALGRVLSQSSVFKLLGNYPASK
ncbi:MAG: prephenate dehydratase [Methanocorpusculum sp.]|nr:prephenate dehydratase [Methanocorpusculum sp.]